VDRDGARMITAFGTLTLVTSNGRDEGISEQAILGKVFLALLSIFANRRSSGTAQRKREDDMVAEYLGTPHCQSKPRRLWFRVGI
jgi:hypothetical protein